jgi:hypothetical protein
MKDKMTTDLEGGRRAAIALLVVEAARLATRLSGFSLPGRTTWLVLVVATSAALLWLARTVPATGKIATSTILVTVGAVVPPALVWALAASEVNSHWGPVAVVILAAAIASGASILRALTARSAGAALGGRVSKAFPLAVAIVATLALGITVVRYVPIVVVPTNWLEVQRLLSRIYHVLDWVTPALLVLAFGQLVLTIQRRNAPTA